MVNGESKIVKRQWVAKISVLYLLTSIFFFPSCKSHKPDISKIKVDLKVERFEKDLFSLDAANKDAAIQSMVRNYGDFFFFYFNDYRMWKMGNDSSVSWKDSVIAFSNDRVLQ